MTETTAKSGGPGAPTTPVDEEPKKDGGAAQAGREPGRDAAGRASVSGDASSPPKFTRAPGMAPPPGDPAADGDASEPKRPASPAVAKASATVPIVTKGKGAAPGTGSRPGTAPGKPGQQPQQPGGGPSGRPGDGRPGDPGAKRPGSGSAAGGAAVGAARVAETMRSARATVSSAAARGPRRARLNLKRIDPWSVMKFSFAVSIVLFIVVVVATSVLYLALDAMGVWTEVNSSLGELVNASGGSASDGGGFRVTAWGVIGTSMLIGAVNVVLFTALATLGAFIYNVCADLVGGVELTLAERD
ncbi:DUF3566 domain-containing protein [Mangrovihabitans endophyticus]|uniref:DUF3566 domain-containing protein n=1 Tax=Mangrovihabitans endophyticus TaxID=1751298 RepID=A0A8J3C1P4_9ACTN|nr:DUF3566 domain-containing protein [Mangrovihabitans endophyticus]GGK94527.1 hypothetical protein GCM10012284_30660 [Mangrovihabitans endophyticus]